MVLEVLVALLVGQGVQVQLQVILDSQEGAIHL